MKSPAGLLLVGLVLYACVYGDSIASGPKTRGMIIGYHTNNALVFDAETDTVLGMIDLPNGDRNVYYRAMDCAISDDQRLGFVTSGDAREIYVIDPINLSMATGVNQIPVSIWPFHATLSHDQKFLISSGSWGEEKSGLSIVDVSARFEASAPFPGQDIISTQACRDGSLLAASTAAGGAVRRFTIDASGAVTDTGESLPLRGVINTACAVGGGSGIGVSLEGHGIESFLYPPLSRSGLDERNIDDYAPGMVVFNPTGTTAYVRSDGGSIKAFTYDAGTGALGLAPYLSFPATSGYGVYSVDAMAMHPDGGKLYVPFGWGVDVYDASTGAPLKHMVATGPILGGAICMPKVSGKTLVLGQLQQLLDDVMASGSEFEPYVYYIKRSITMINKSTNMKRYELSCRNLSQFLAALTGHEGQSGFDASLVEGFRSQVVAIQSALGCGRGPRNDSDF